MALDFSYYEMAEVDDEAGNNPTFTAVPGNCTSSAMPLVTSKLLELASPPTVTPGDSDDGITTGGSNSSGGSSSGSDDADGGGDDEDDDEDQQMFHRPTAPTYVPPTTIRTRTYHEEVRYRDAIFRPFLMNQDWDRGPDFRLCRDFVSSCRDQDDNVVPNNVITLDRAHDTYPYVWDYEWEVVPGLSHLGKGDLVMTNGTGDFITVEIKWLTVDPGKAARCKRNKARRELNMQALRYCEALRLTLKAKYPNSRMEVEAAILTNESDSDIASNRYLPQMIRTVEPLIKY